MSRYVFRRSTLDDIEQLNAIYFKRTGWRRTRIQYDWEWLQHPIGSTWSWVVVEADTGLIAAHHGVVPVPMQIEGKSIRAGRTENTMLNSDFIGKIPYSGFEALALKEMSQHFDLIMTADGGRGASAIRRRLGYQVVGRWLSLTVGMDWRYLACRMRLPVVGWNNEEVAPRERVVMTSKCIVERTDDCDRVGRIWSEARQNYKLAPSRDAQYIEWRFVKHPYTTHHLFVLRVDGKDAGFFATRLLPGPGGTLHVMVVDAFTTTNSPESYSSLLKAARAVWRGLPTRVIVEVLDSGYPLRLAAETMMPSYVRGKGDFPEFLAFFSNKDMAQLEWQPTMVISEGL